MRRKLHIIHRETSLRRPFSTEKDRGMNALERGKSVDGRTSDESRLTTTPRYFFNFSRIPSPSLSFREERNTAERNLIEENKSESRAQNSFCPRFVSCQPASPGLNPRDYYFKVNNLSTKSETRLLTTFTLSTNTLNL